MSEGQLLLNVGCGYDVREGWVNIDPSSDHPEVIPGDARALTRWYKQADTVLLNHVLHLFEPDEARGVLEQCWYALKPGGVLYVVEADVLGIVYWLGECSTWDNVQAVASLISDEVEPTLEGKVLRWVTWHGTRRSLWGVQSLVDALERAGFTTAREDRTGEWDVARPDESFVVVATK